MVMYDGSDCKLFDVMCFFCVVMVGYVVDGMFVIFFKDIDVNYVFVYKFFVGYWSYYVMFVVIEYNYIVDI